MTQGDHLSPKAREALSLPVAERIQYIQHDRFVGYTHANSIMGRLDDLRTHPSSNRMPNMLLVGRTNNGKSHLVKHYRDLHPPQSNPGGDGIIVPVLYIEAPGKPEITALYSSILSLLCVPHKTNSKEEILEAQVIKILKSINLGLLVIDELHNLIAGSLLKQRAYLNSLKRLGNQIERSIIGVGTVEALRAIQIDDQLSNRFAPEVLPPWQLDKDFLRLLASFERIIPLGAPSNLVEKTLAMKLHAMCEGSIGELSRLLNEAAIWAIRNTKTGEPERIDERALKECGFIPPSRRKEEGRRA